MTTSAGVGLSRDADPLRAARQASRTALERAGLEGADWGLVFATGSHRPHYAAMLKAIQETLATESLFGCSAWGVLTGTEEIEGEPGVAVLAVRSDRIEGRTLIAPADDEEGSAAAREIALQASGGAGPGLLVLLPDPLALRPDPFLRELRRIAPGAQVIGGAASGDPRADSTFQFYGRNVATRSLAGLHLSGAFTPVIGVTQGCQPLGDSCRITRSASNLIMELDGRRALDVLRQRLPAALRDSLDQLAGHLFVGLPPDPGQERIDPGEYLVRNLLGADRESGALAIGGPIREGEPIVLALREGQSARDDLKQMLGRVVRPPSGAAYRFGFYFNCAARGTSLYGMPGIDTAYISSALGELPIIGFFGNAEIAPLRGANRLFTHTGVLALVAETA